MKKVVDWQRVRITYETGAETIVEIARRHGLSRQIVHRRAARYSWNRKLRAAVLARAHEKLAAEKFTESFTRDRARTAQIIEAEATKVASVIQQHRDDWAQIKQVEDRAYATAHDENGAIQPEHLDKAIKLAALAKLNSENLTIIQAEERRLYRLDEPLPEVGDGELEAEIDRYMLPEKTA